MNQEQADRMEEMISTLITMMGSFKSEIRSEVTEVKAEIIGVKTEINEMRTEITGIKTKVKEMKTELTGVKTEIQEMKTELTGVKTEIQEMKTDITEMKTEIDGIKNSQLSMQEELRQIRVENNERHSEIIARFEILEANQEHTWEKTVMNERDIAVMKKLAK